MVFGFPVYRLKICFMMTVYVFKTSKLIHIKNATNSVNYIYYNNNTFKILNNMNHKTKIALISRERIHQNELPTLLFNVLCSKFQESWTSEIQILNHALCQYTNNKFMFNWSIVHLDKQLRNQRSY